MLPPDVALAVSLATGTRGPSGRGRMFLGNLNSTNATNTGLITQAASDVLGNATTELFRALRDINSAGIPSDVRFSPCVYTKTPNKGGGNADTASIINHVRISDEFDTQRRRDHQRQDNYSSYGTV